ncbi:hypothetical protein ACFFQW_49285 [Umezawaea endophytica]|uniref:DUF3618 domain-containing protein n=1 Tax=Umezawaea endophytica TaxID=1654476 RepID=A0A9X2VUC4_9PSEU|nr:hypothetical protein [Umezawaea endophytica]MCS7482973.1 hypothetical protein [Umezawaea endophytica]
MTDIRDRSTGSDSTVGAVASTASQEGTAVAHHAKDAATEVASTAKEQTQHVAHEAKQQTKQVMDDVRQRVGREADEQARRVSQGLAKLADELSSMAEHASGDSPTAGAVRQVADTGRQAARFLDERGAGGLLETAQDFARRKPGAFLIGAAVAGLLVGRVVKSVNGSPDSRQETRRPNTAQPAQAETWQTTPPAVTPAAVSPTTAGPDGAVVEPVVRPYVDPLVPGTPRPITPGGGAAHVQP